MGRPSSVKEFASAKGGRNPVEQLNMLRDFVSGTGTWTETELTDCLRQCGFNVQRAAERLMTGQYKPSNGKKTNGKSAYFSMVASSPVKKKKASSTAAVYKRQAKIDAKPPPSSVQRAPKGPPSIPSTAPKQAKATLPKVTPKTPVEDLTVDDNTSCWLLCQRWLSDALCTTKNGRLAYKESLDFTHSLTGHSVVRFRGQGIEGRLPENLSAMLTPLLRHENATLVRLQGEALMEESRLPIGAQVPISLTVYIADPEAFFGLFVGEAETKTSMFFQSKERKSKKNRLPITEAAFHLLQWAEYGDVPEFKPPDEERGEETSPAEDNDEDAVEMNEDDFEAASVAESTAEARVMEASVTTANDWAMSLPEAKDPEGFVSDVTLRPYQKQALYWMMKREQQGESREELEKQLQLMSELAERPKSRQPSFPVGQESREIICDCGPVLVSEEAKKKSKTFDGQVNPVNHPLWQRRFLASKSLNESISFYVNELLGVATHLPPDPPKPCSGGILADAMGLGKTVMLMALVMKSKEERISRESEGPCGPTSTLVVAKLSLLPQWEDELKTKTSLSYRIYYGQQGSKTPSIQELEGVDVVVTTYGTMQGELKRKNPVLMDCKWHRVILDEAHCIRNQHTLASKVCCSLTAEHRWCVSGTIIQNSLDDVFGVMKFLRHEPWCLPGFWKAAITKPMNRASDDLDNEGRAEGMAMALDRVRRLLAPMMLRRTKDSVTKDGKPILTLPPVEAKVIKVELSESEREFYNAVLARSQEVFDGFIEAGTAAKSYIQIFSMLQRLRQVCDHIALTVRSRIVDEDWNASSHNEIVEDGPKSPKKATASEDALGQQFLEGLLSKFCSKQPSPKKKRNDTETESPVKRPKDQAYLTKVAHALSEAVQENSTHVNEECPICLENPKLDKAVVTPCAHIFCRDCLVGFLREKAPAECKDPSKIASVMQCPDGLCPCCNEKVEAKRIIALSKSNVDGHTMTTTYLTSMKPAVAAIKQEIRETAEGNPHAVARQILENAVNSAESSKMTAILNELDNVWEVDPGSKVLIFSQYLGFLDLLQSQLRGRDIPLFRLDGSLTLKERMVVLDEFRSSPKSGVATDAEHSRGTVLLMSMSAGGEGLNLVAASAVFLVDLWWNAAKEDQCVNRVHRIGQIAPLIRVRRFVVTDSVEERILELQSRKKYVAEEIYNDVGREGGMGSARLSLDEFRLIFQK